MMQDVFFTNLFLISFYYIIITMRRVRAQMMFDDEEQVLNKPPQEVVRKTGHIKSKEWIKLFQFNKSQKLKNYILDFFISEGHYDLARTFSQESGIPLNITKSDEQNIKKRYQIKQLIQKGQIDEAIKKIQQINGKFFIQQSQQQNSQHIINQNNVDLLFSLKGLKVINLIKNQKLSQAIATARKQLLPFVSGNIKNEQNQNYMQKIEEIMSLLAFSDIKQADNYELTTTQYRTQISNEVNRLLLNRPIDSKNQALVQLIKLGKWFQKRLSKYVQFPKFQISNNEQVFSTTAE